MDRFRRLETTVPAIAVVLALGGASERARAAPGAEVGTTAKVDTGSGATAKRRGFEWPERVVGGNAISLLVPMQWGFVGYLPRVRLGLQYDRQIVRAHWVYVGAAALLDRGNHAAFRTDCGLENSAGELPPGSCEAGTVAGIDLYAGYAYKLHLRKMPYLVPVFRGALGWSWWKYPDLGGDSEQARVHTWTFSARIGGGLRVFLLGDLALGLDLNLPLGLAVHRDEPIDAPATNVRRFVLGLEILPVVVEYRF